MKVPLKKGISRERMDINLAAYTLKISVPSIKFIKVLDLAGKINYKSKENSFLYEDDLLSCNLVKSEEGEVWDSLIESKLSKHELKARREEDIKLKEEEQQQYYKTVSDLKISELLLFFNFCRI